MSITNTKCIEPRQLKCPHCHWGFKYEIIGWKYGILQRISTKCWVCDGNGYVYYLDDFDIHSAMAHKLQYDRPYISYDPEFTSEEQIHLAAKYYTERQEEFKQIYHDLHFKPGE